MIELTIKDEFDFLKNVTPANNHRFFLLWALELTKIGDVLELGCGEGSTPFLQKYCKANKRTLYSYDSERFWADKYGAQFINADWEKSGYCDRNYSVALIDEAPANHRNLSIKKLIDKVDIFVAHDTEPENEKHYQMTEPISIFKYILHDKKESIWSTIFSNKCDIVNYKVKIIQ